MAETFAEENLTVSDTSIGVPTTYLKGVGNAPGSAFRPAAQRLVVTPIDGQVRARKDGNAPVPATGPGTLMNKSVPYYVNSLPEMYNLRLIREGAADVVVSLRWQWLDGYDSDGGEGGSSAGVWS